MRRRIWIGMGCLLAGMMTAGHASAQSHYLLARTNGSFNGQATSDPNDDHVEHLLQAGVGGVNPSFYAIQAVTDSASGVMTIGGAWSLAGGAADPILPPSTYHSATRIAQDLDPGTPIGDTVTVRATLDWGGGAQMDSSGDVDRTDLSAQLRLGDCQAYFRRSIYSNGLVQEDPIDCSDSVATGTAAGGAITVTAVYPAAGIGSLTRFHVDAQLAADVDNPVEYGDSGQYQVSGSLSVEVQGLASYSFASPTFLTVPEAGGETAGGLALAGVLALAWTRRGPS